MTSTKTHRWQCPRCGRRNPDLALGELCPHDGVVVVPEQTLKTYPKDPFLGLIIDDRYRLFDILGMGGFGSVYRALDVVTHRQVAIKTIRPGSDKQGADARTRFLQEARLLAELENERIVEVYHFGAANLSQEGTHGFDELLYMVLELVPGLSLKRIIRREKLIPVRRAVNIVMQILDGLAHAHDHGLIHRDLKPGNILVVEGERDTVKVIDFGIAKVLEENEDHDSPKTGTGLVLGTVRYMAPEQLKQGTEIGPHTDLYALGVIFFEMVTGKTPFNGSQAEIAAAHLYREPPLLPAGLSTQALQDWFARVMLKSGHERFTDALTMAAALTKASAHAEERSVPDTIRMQISVAQEVLSKEKSDVGRGVDSIHNPSSAARAGGEDKAQAPDRSDARLKPEEGRSLPDTVREVLMESAKNKPSAAGDGPTTSAGPTATQADEIGLEDSSDSLNWSSNFALTSPLPPSEAAQQFVGQGAEAKMAEGSSIQTRGELGLPQRVAEDGMRWWLVPFAVLIALTGTLFAVHPPASLETDGSDSMTAQSARSPARIIEIPAIQDAGIHTLSNGSSDSVGIRTEIDPTRSMKAATGQIEATDILVVRRSSTQEASSSGKPDLGQMPAVSPSASQAQTKAKKTVAKRKSKPKSKSRGRTSRRVRSKKERSIHRKRNAFNQLEKGLIKQLNKCRCRRGRVLLEQLPADFPSARRKTLKKRVEACRVPTVDQRCVDGRVE